MNRPNKDDYTKWIKEDDHYVSRGLKEYYEDLEKYCDTLEITNKKLIDRIRILGGEEFINPCDGCQDYCYKNDSCKSNGGCGNVK